MTENINRYCQAIKLDGTPCHAWGSKTTGLCPVHSPNAHEIQVSGGKSKNKAHMLESRLDKRLKPILDLLADSIRQCHEGTLPPARATAMASLATALIKVTEFAQYGDRLEQLENEMRNCGLIS